mmetsp:Transcript_13564/g.15213  ORF Transcript_13564/g.15213 Transcript_13564/m.15213 type:complete len:162 (-) Transcript_13564:50-535(-)
MINMKHFCDHFKRIMPNVKPKIVDKEELELQKFKDWSSCDRSTTSQFTTPGIHDATERLKEEIIALREEIDLSIDAISKLAPLIPEFISFKTKDISTAAMVVTIKHSLKCLPNNIQKDKPKFEKLKLLFSKWIQSLFFQYGVNKEVVKDLIQKIKVFLDRV